MGNESSEERKEEKRNLKQGIAKSHATHIFRSGFEILSQILRSGFTLRSAPWDL